MLHCKTLEMQKHFHLGVLLFHPTVKGHHFHNCFPDPFPYLFPLSCFMAFVSFLSCLMVLESPAIGDALLSVFFLFSGSASDKSFECGISSAQVGVLIHINLILPRGGDMAKLTDKQHKKIIARYAECQNLSQVAREFNVSVSTIKRHLDGDKETVKRVNQKKRAEHPGHDCLHGITEKQGTGVY